MTLFVVPRTTQPAGSVAFLLMGAGLHEASSLVPNRTTSKESENSLRETSCKLPPKMPGKMVA